jgi:hypothetical protein
MVIPVGARGSGAEELLIANMNRRIPCHGTRGKESRGGHQQKLVHEFFLRNVPRFQAGAFYWAARSTKRELLHYR